MIIGLTGFAQSGKDTAAEFLIERGFKRLAFADILRQSLYNLNPPITMLDGDHGTSERFYVGHVRAIVDRVGWDVAKVEYTEIRELLQRFGTEVGRELYGENFWVDAALAQIPRHTAKDCEGNVIGNWVLTDVRFPNEEQAVHRLGGLLFRIERPGTEAVNPHASEAHVLTMPVDGVIRNTGDLDAYKREVLRVTGQRLD